MFSKQEIIIIQNLSDRFNFISDKQITSKTGCDYNKSYFKEDLGDLYCDSIINVIKEHKGTVLDGSIMLMHKIYPLFTKEIQALIDDGFKLCLEDKRTYEERMVEIPIPNEKYLFTYMKKDSRFSYNPETTHFHYNTRLKKDEWISVVVNNYFYNNKKIQKMMKEQDEAIFLDSFKNMYKREIKKIAKQESITAEEEKYVVDMFSKLSEYENIVNVLYKYRREEE